MATAPPTMNGVHSTRCTQIGGAKRISTRAASPTTIKPRIRITKTAGPSPASWADRSSPQTSHAGRTLKSPANNLPLPQRGHRHPSAARSGETGVKFSSEPASRSIGSGLPRHPGAAAALAPPIDADKQEQPHDVDEMPVPGSRLEPEMMVGFEMPGPCPIETDDQKCRPDDDVETVKPGGHEKSRRIDAVGEMKRRVAVLPSLNRGEADAEKDSQRQPAQQSAAVALDQRMVRPGDRGSGQQQYQRVEKRELERIEGVDGLGRPDAADREQARREERPEKRGEEHHLRGDEQRHAVA